jgi:hypothetical protein
VNPEKKRKEKKKKKKNELLRKSINLAKIYRVR